MPKKLLISLFCVVAVLSSVLLLAAAHPDAGSPAPQFTLKSQDGTPVNLQDFRGKWVVLYFYPKDFTSGCTLEAHNFQRDLAEYEKRNAVIVGVSVDDANSHKQFCVKEGLSFKLLADTDHNVSKEYGTLTEMGFPHASRNTFLISPDGKVAHVFNDVKPAEHSAQVLAVLTELEKK
jgi:thioredoxin-dependent peroxiredoxin